MPSIELLGLSGKAGTGKDFISQTYLRPYGYLQYSLSWHFKVGIVGEGVATYDEVFKTKPEHIRHLLQQRGTEDGRMKYGDNVWLDHAYTWMQVFSETWGINKFVIADIRFPNEVEFIQHHGGKVFRIDAPLRAAISPLSAIARIHTSETALDSYIGFDGTIHNDPNPTTPVDAQISALLNVPLPHLPGIADTLSIAIFGA
jgi:hypothetical protein